MSLTFFCFHLTTFVRLSSALNYMIVGPLPLVVNVTDISGTWTGVVEGVVFPVSSAVTNWKFVPPSDPWTP
jgi:hypothetical protein